MYHGRSESLEKSDFSTCFQQGEVSGLKDEILKLALIKTHPITFLIGSVFGVPKQATTGRRLPGALDNRRVIQASRDRKVLVLVSKDRCRNQKDAIPVERFLEIHGQRLEIPRLGLQG